MSAFCSAGSVNLSPASAMAIDAVLRDALDRLGLNFGG